MAETRRMVLPPRSEYRFELDAGEILSVRLVPDPMTGIRGDAEVFGMSLATGGQDKWHVFGHEARASIVSWGGAEIELAGSASIEYLADEQSPLFTYGANLHLHLERLRLRAREQLRTDAALQSQLAALDVEDVKMPQTNEPDPVYHPGGQGPRVMVVGPESAGKTSLIKFLSNYALRSPAVASVGDSENTRRTTRRDAEDHSDDDEPEDAHGLSEITGWWPVVVALDPSEGAVPLPGCMSALPLSPLPMSSMPSPSPAVPYGVTLQTSGSLPPNISLVQSVVPLIHWLGRHNVRENEQHSRRVVDWLAHGVEKRLAKDLRARMSGLLIDMPGVVTADARSRYSFVQYVAKALKVDIIIVLGHEKLTVELMRIYNADPSGAPQIVKMPKSSGAVEADEVYKQRVQDLQVRSYFYGLGALEAHDEEGNSRATIPGASEPIGGVPTLNPYSTTIPIDLLDVYRIGQDRVAPSSALPIGAARVLSEIQVVKLDQENSSSDLSSLMHSVLAIIDRPQAKMVEGEGGEQVPAAVPEDELVGAAVIGFIHVCVLADELRH